MLEKAILPFVLLAVLASQSCKRAEPLVTELILGAPRAEDARLAVGVMKKRLQLLGINGVVESKTSSPEEKEIRVLLPGVDDPAGVKGRGRPRDGRERPRSVAQIRRSDGFVRPVCASHQEAIKVFTAEGGPPLLGQA